MQTVCVFEGFVDRDYFVHALLSLKTSLLHRLNHQRASLILINFPTNPKISSSRFLAIGNILKKVLLDTPRATQFPTRNFGELFEAQKIEEIHHWAASMKLENYHNFIKAVY